MAEVYHAKSEAPLKRHEHRRKNGWKAPLFTTQAITIAATMVNSEYSSGRLSALDSSMKYGTVEISSGPDSSLRVRGRVAALWASKRTVRRGPALT